MVQVLRSAVDLFIKFVTEIYHAPEPTQKVILRGSQLLGLFTAAIYCVIVD
ncbi:hypothetical protein DSUL_50372 [Desulfovibrionales bacterium]